MAPYINSNLTALGAFGKKMAVHANNIANVNSDGFKRSRALIQEGTKGTTVRTQVSQVNSPGYKYSEMIGDKMVERELSNVDIAGEFTQTMLTKRYFQANLKMFSTMDKMLGSVIDIFE